MFAYLAIRTVVRALSAALAAYESTSFVLRSIVCFVLSAFVRPTYTRDPQLHHTPVLVTGCSSGVGKHLALELATRGYHVFATVRTQRHAAELLAAFKQQSVLLPHAKLEPVLLDVRDDAALDKAFEQVQASLGKEKLFGIVNNAAAFTGTGSLDQVDMDGVKEAFETNVLGVLRLTNRFLPLFLGYQHKGSHAQGRIVNIGSLAAWHTMSGMGVYCATKAAVETLSRTMQIEHAISDHIRVSTVSLGCITTPAWDKVHVQGAARHLIALCRAISIPTDHVVRAVVFALQSPWPKSRYYVGLDAYAASILPQGLSDRMVVLGLRVLEWVAP